MSRTLTLPVNPAVVKKGALWVAIGLLVLGWLVNTPSGLLGKADAVGYAVCHRIDVRSFHLGVRQLPLCARCSGMYLGAMLGLIFQAMTYPRRAGMPPRKLWLPLALFVAAFGVDGVNSYLHLFPGVPGLYEPQNWLRLLTGTGMGLGLAAMVYPAFNQSLWKNPDTSPALPGFRNLLGLMVLALAVDGLVQTENPFLLYPLALISAAGVLVLLTMIYTLVWLMVFRLENHFEESRQLILPLLGGFGLALLQIAALDALRYLLTGTWGGFNLG